MELKFQLSETVNRKLKATTGIRVNHYFFKWCFSKLIRRQTNRKKVIDNRRMHLAFRKIFADEGMKRKSIRFLKENDLCCLLLSIQVKRANVMQSGSTTLQIITSCISRAWVQRIICCKLWYLFTFLLLPIFSLSLNLFLLVEEMLEAIGSHLSLKEEITTQCMLQLDVDTLSWAGGS